MYEVSEYYKSAISKNTKAWCIKVEVKQNRKSETIVVLEGDDLITDTFSMSRQSTSKSNFSIGGVCAAEASLTLTYEGIQKLSSRNLLRKDICFKIRTWLKTEDPEQSDDDFSMNIDGTENITGLVENGFLYIYEIKNADYACDVKLYDSMLAFDCDFSTKDAISLEQGAKTIYGWLELFCSSCSNESYDITIADGVEEKLINNTVLINVDSSADLNTYRDAIGYLSILAGGFAVIDRSGELDIRYYNNDNVAVIGDSLITEYYFDENVYSVESLSTSIAGFDYNIESDEVLEDALRADLFINENTFLRGIQPQDAENLTETVRSFIDNIFDRIKFIRFLGGSFETPCRPELDVGDCVSINVKVLDKSGGKSVIVPKTYSNILICGHSWRYQTYSTVKCRSYSEVSSSTRSSSPSKTTGSGGVSVANTVMRFVGTEDVSLRGGRQDTLFNVVFLLDANMECLVSFTAIANIAEAGDIEFIIIYDNIEYICRPKYTSQVGWFTYSFSIGLAESDSDMQHSLVINAMSYGVVLDISKFDYQVIVTASGMGGAEDEWTGRYDISERVRPIAIGGGNIVINSFSEAVEHTV